MTALKNVNRTVAVTFKIPPREIQFTSWILQDYEGVGILETVNPKTGVIVVHTNEDFTSEVIEIIKNLSLEYRSGKAELLSHSIVKESEHAVDDEDRAEDRSG